MMSALPVLLTLAISAVALIIFGVAKIIWSVLSPGKYDDEPN
jgi:nitrogen fixation-related uncharacterized protein